MIGRILAFAVFLFYVFFSGTLVDNKETLPFVARLLVAFVNGILMGCGWNWLCEQYNNRHY